MKNTTNIKRVALICAILTALLLITGCSSEPTAQDTPTTENVEFTGEVQVSDEEALRKALKSKEDCTVILSGDIVITEELTVNGNKKLSGGSIIMDLRREGAGESVLAVSKGANLVLDGTTVDGNGVADCVTVKAGACLESVSGSLIYGYPYGLDVSGAVKINDIHIDEAMHTAVNVAIFGEVDMLGGTISNNLYGISVAKDARMDMADGVVMTNSYGSFIVNYGDMDIAGGKYIGSHENAIENYGKMSIKGTEEDPIEISGGKKSALNSKNKSTLTAENIKILNMGWHGMCVEKGSTATLKNIHLENAVKSTLYINSSKVKMENVSVIGGQLYAIYATQNAEVEMYDITVKDTNNRGIYNERSTVTVDGLLVENTAQNGFYSVSDTSVSHISNAKFYGTGTSAIGVSKGEVTVTNSEIESTAKEGVAVLENGAVTLEGVTIKDNGNFAIGNYGGKVTATNVQISNTTNVSVKLMDACTFNGNGLTITNAGKQAISVEGGSTAYVTNSYISGTRMAGVNVDNAYLQMSGTRIENTGSYGLAAQKGGKAVLYHIEVYNAGTRGIGALNSYVVATNIKVYNPGGVGMYTEGADSQLNMNQVEVYNAGSCGFGFKGGKEITARNVLIENPKNEGIYAFNGANVTKLDNVVIKNAGSHGISVEGEAIVTITADTSYNPENTQDNGITITNPGRYGLRAFGGKIVAENATVTDAKEYGINAGKDGSITVKNCVVENPGKYGINISAGGTVNVTDTTVTNAGERGVNSEGKLTVDGLTLDTTTNHGIYLGAAATVEGSDLTIQNVGNNAIFSEGANITVDGLTVANVAKQGIQLKGGTVRLSNIDIKETTNAAVYARNSTKLTLENGVISAYGVGLATTDSAEATAKNITIERGAKNGKDGTGLLVQAEKTSILDLQSGTKLDGKGKTNEGVKVVTNTATVILNGATITGNSTDVVLASGAKITVNSALTKTLTVKPATYEGGTVIAVKGSDISDADFKASTKLIDVGSETSYVGEDGKLVATAALLNGVSYGSLEDAIDDAVDGDTIKILAEVSTITKTVTKGVKLTADTAVTITVDSALNAYAFNVASGKTLTVEGTGSGKISIESASTGKEVFYNQGTVNLTNVAVSGGKYAVNNRADATLNMTNVTVANTGDNGLHLAGGTTTVTNVTISNTTGHGIGSYGNLVLKPVAEGQIALTISEPGKNGIYASYDSVITGSGLSIKNTTSAGILGDENSKYPDGIDVKLSNVTIENTGTQGIQVKRGKADISGFTIKNTGAAAVYTLNSVELALSDGTIYANTKGIAVINDAETVLTNVTLERTGTGTDPLVDISGNAKLELAGTTKIDAKNSGAVGVKVAASGATFTMNNITITGTETAVELASGAMITVKSKLTSAISVKLDDSAYAVGTKVAVNGSGISDADFKASMELLRPVDAKWIVDENGLLAKASCEHNYEGVQTTAPTCTATGVMTYTCSLCGNSYTESIPALGHTVVHVVEKIPTLEAAGNIEYWYCSVCNTYWNDAENENVIAKEAVTLPMVEEGNVAYMNGTAYETLEAAVTAANETAGADTVYLLTDVQINAQLKATTDITITATKAATVTVTDKVTGSVIYVTDGTLNITGASEDAKITIAASTKSQSMVKLNGGNAVLTNVHLKGNTASTVTVANGNCIQNEKGTLTAKSVTITDSKGDGIRVYAGATANLDNVTISGTGKYGVNILGTLNIYNTVRADHALTVSNTADHGIRVEGTLESHLNSVPTGTYAIKAENNKGRGVVAVNSGKITISHISVTSSGDCGIDFLNNSGGSVSDFVITTTKKAGINKASGTVSLANGSITTSNVCIQTSDTKLTASNITVKRTAEGDALNINGATSFEGITVTTE